MEFVRGQGCFGSYQVVKHLSSFLEPKCNFRVLKLQLIKLLNLYVAIFWGHYPFLQKILVRYLLTRSMLRYRFLRKYVPCLCQVEYGIS